MTDPAPDGPDHPPAAATLSVLLVGVLTWAAAAGVTLSAWLSFADITGTPRPGVMESIGACILTLAALALTLAGTRLAWVLGKTLI